MCGFHIRKYYKLWVRYRCSDVWICWNARLWHVHQHWIEYEECQSIASQTARNCRYNICKGRWRNLQNVLEKWAKVSKIHENHGILRVFTSIHSNRVPFLFHLLHLYRKFGYIDLGSSIQYYRSIRYTKPFRMVFTVGDSAQHEYFICFVSGFSYIVFCVLLLLYSDHLWSFWYVG